MIDWPAPADALAASRLVERFAACSLAAREFAASGEGSALLAAIGGGSPYLSDLAVREHQIVLAFVGIGADKTLEATMEALAATPPAATRAAVAAALRLAKRQAALVIALADIGRLWSLACITGAITALAETALRLAVAHLLLAAHRAGSLHLADPEAPERASGLIVLGMGKLGARELNYSSDIDLVLLYRSGRACQGLRGSSATFTRIARALVTMMEVKGRRRLRVPHGPPPAPRPCRDAPRRRPARRHRLLRDRWARTGSAPP